MGIVIVKNFAGCARMEILSRNEMGQLQAQVVADQKWLQFGAFYSFAIILMRAQTAKFSTVRAKIRAPLTGINPHSSSFFSLR